MDSRSRPSEKPSFNVVFYFPCHYVLARSTPMCLFMCCSPCEREVQYLVYNLAHLMGYMEVLRRETPRQLSFLKVWASGRLLM